MTVKGDYAITFACLNQVAYTRQCVDSLVRTGVDLGRVVAVDNHSSDETRSYLESLPLGGRIFNKTNLGCGVAWNQGALAIQAEWSVIMNNDVVVAPGWLDALLDIARERSLKIVCPAMIEGDLDYDLDAFAQDAARRMQGAIRLGRRHAVCMAVHNSVWLEIGYFQPVPRLLGFEDSLFFNEVRKAAIPTAITGASWIHHFGSITQSAMKRERGLAAKQALGGPNLNRLLGLGWAGRKAIKFRNKRQLRAWREQELAEYAMTLHGVRGSGTFQWL